jgi:Ca2+-binding EF-hand superfamily protein
VFLGKLQRRENLMVAFQHFDSDGSGFITEEELLSVRDRSASGGPRSSCQTACGAC